MELKGIIENYDRSGAMDLGIYLFCKIDELEKFTVEQFITNKRSEGKPCFVVFPHEWASKSNQILSHVRSYDNKDLKVIYGRNCLIKEISLKEVRNFCDLYHIQGSNKLGIVGWGLFNENELVGVMSLGRHHRNTNEILLDRLCFRNDVRIIGGSNKLFCSAVKWAMENDISEIISFSDNRYSIGGVYEALNFKLDTNIFPDYFYVYKTNFVNRLSKQSQKKSNTNCPLGMTEKAWAELNGLIQVYDGGKKRWKYKIKLEKHVKTKNSFSFRKQGYYQTKKAGIIYYQSTYELRAACLLDEMEDIVSYSVQVRFFYNKRERFMDFLAKRKNGTFLLIEVKPARRLDECKEQIEDNKNYALNNHWDFVIWTEKELGFSSEYYIRVWSDQFLTEITSIDFVSERKKRDCERVKKYYDNNIATDKVTIYCEYCKTIHTPLRLTYEPNVDRNGYYVCEALGGHIAGSLPKDHLKKANEFESIGMKKCEGKNSCGRVLPLDQFSKRKSVCKECRAKIYKQKYRDRNPKKEE